MKKAIILLTLACMGVSLQAQTPKTVREFLDMSKSDTTLCELTGVVSRIRNNERSRLFIDDGTGTVLIYGLSDERDRGIMALDVRKGDTLTVQGRRTVYDGRVIEMKYARYIRHSEGPDHKNVPRKDELDRDPSFRGGGMEKFSKWVSAHLEYPKEALDAYSDAPVVVQFVVGFDGSVQEVEIVRKSHPSIDAEVLRVVKKSPKWKPGMVDGHTVRVKQTLPVVFISDF